LRVLPVAVGKKLRYTPASLATGPPPPPKPKEKKQNQKNRGTEGGENQAPKQGVEKRKDGCVPKKAKKNSFKGVENKPKRGFKHCCGGLGHLETLGGERVPRKKQTENTWG